MKTRSSDSQLSVTLAFFAVGLAQWFAGTAEAGRDDLLESLVQRNDAAWQRIQSLESIQYTLERQWLDRQSQKPFTGVAQVKERGDFLWYAYRSTVPGGPLRVIEGRDIQIGNTTRTIQTFERDSTTGQTSQQEQRLVANDRYVAKWLVGNPVAYCQDCNSVDAMKEAIGRLPWGDPFAACFGTTGQRFREATQQTSDRIRFEAVEVEGADGRSLFQIRRFYPKESVAADLIWVIDPNRGYLAVEQTFYAGSETPIRCLTMRVEEVEPGLWYPVAFEEVSYTTSQEPAAEAPPVEGWTKAAVRDLKINEPIGDEQFEISALRLDGNEPGVMINWRTLDGQMQLYVYRDGRLVMQEMPERNRRPAGR